MGLPQRSKLLPIQIFLKVSENNIRKSELFRIRMRSIEQSYNKMIDVLSRNPRSITEPEIETILSEEVRKVEEEETKKLA